MPSLLQGLGTHLRRRPELLSDASSSLSLCCFQVARGGREREGAKALAPGVVLSGDACPLGIGHLVEHVVNFFKTLGDASPQQLCHMEMCFHWALPPLPPVPAHITAPRRLLLLVVPWTGSQKSSTAWLPSMAPAWPQATHASLSHQMRVVGREQAASSLCGAIPSQFLFSCSVQNTDQ